MGNVNPLKAGVRGTSPGMPRENNVALQRALAEFSRAHLGQA